jgi:hypothetical protein
MSVWRSLSLPAALRSHIINGTLIRLEEYKQNAKHCRALAALVTRLEDKVALEEIAEAWEKVAAFRERDLHEADE